MSAAKPAKKPADREPKKPTVKDFPGGKEITFHDIVVKDASGKAILDDEEKPSSLKVLLQVEALDDYDLLEQMGKLDTSPAILPAVLRGLLGDQAETVVNSHRDENGKAKFSEMNAWLMRLLGAFNPS